MKIKKELAFYLVFGVLTTLVNIISYVLFSRIIRFNYKEATTIAWVISVVFAYITNKLYVFNSKGKDMLTVIKEFLSFILCRILSYLIDIVTMIALIEGLNLDDMVAKIIVNIIVAVINYFASKFFIFRITRD